MVKIPNAPYKVILTKEFVYPYSVLDKSRRKSDAIYKAHCDLVEELSANPNGSPKDFFSTSVSELTNIKTPKVKNPYQSKQGYQYQPLIHALIIDELTRRHGGFTPETNPEFFKEIIKEEPKKIVKKIVEKKLDTKKQMASNQSIVDQMRATALNLISDELRRTRHINDLLGTITTTTTTHGGALSTGEPSVNFEEVRLDGTISPDIEEETFEDPEENDYDPEEDEDYDPNYSSRMVLSFGAIEGREYHLTPKALEEYYDLKSHYDKLLNLIPNY